MCVITTLISSFNNLINEYFAVDMFGKLLHENLVEDFMCFKI